MGRFKKHLQGIRPRKTVILPFLGASFDMKTAEWSGPIDKVDLRPLGPDEYDLVLARAAKFVKDHGREPGEDENELYERGKIVHTLAIACIDPDEPTDSVEPGKYFESWEEIHTAKSLTPEILDYLIHQQRCWQDEVSPLRRNMSEEDYIDGVRKLAEGELDFFLYMRSGMQLSFALSMARQLSRLMKNESPTSSSPAASGSPG